MDTGVYEGDEISMFYDPMIAKLIPVTLDLGDDGDAEISIDGGKPHALVTDWVPGQHLVEGSLDGKAFAVKFADRTEGYLFRHRGVALRALVCTPQIAELHARLPEKPKPDTSKLIISPMPGLVVSIDVELDQEVQEGEAVCVVEAMKMQNIIRAEATGTVKAINVAAGDSVAADEIMVEFA
jgi:propionyl-CoA carboxylase alpha chain